MWRWIWNIYIYIHIFAWVFFKLTFSANWLSFTLVPLAFTNDVHRVISQALAAGISAVQSQQLQWSARCVPRYCRCSSTFEPTTQTKLKPPSEKAACGFLLLPLSTAMKEFPRLYWSLCAHRNEVSAWVFPALTTQQEDRSGRFSPASSSP